MVKDKNIFVKFKDTREKCALMSQLKTFAMFNLNQKNVDIDFLIQKKIEHI